MSVRRQIKKYANRRLYDTQASRHVTLADIRRMIVDGTDVEIVDDVSGENITRQLLLQIIVDSEQARDPLLNELLLTRLIRFYGNPMQHVMGDYLEQSVSTFLTQQESFRTQMETAMSRTPLDTLQAMMKTNVAAWETLFGAATGTAQAAPAEAARDAARPAAPAPGRASPGGPASGDDD